MPDTALSYLNTLLILVVRIILEGSIIVISILQMRILQNEGENEVICTGLKYGVALGCHLQQPSSQACPHKQETLWPSQEAFSSQSGVSCSTMKII